MFSHQEHYPKIKGIPPIEQVGSYDPMPNEHGEKLCALNLERVAFYLSQGVKVSQDVSMLLGKVLMCLINYPCIKSLTKTYVNLSVWLTGLAGFLPQNPHTYKTAWRNREELKYKEESEKYNSDAK